MEIQTKNSRLKALDAASISPFPGGVGRGEGERILKIVCA
jgi:hypothetical protein